MKNALFSSELLVADLGYSDEKALLKTDIFLCQRNFHSSVRARHETLNRRIKQFSALSEKFRHGISKHAVCVFAVCKITQVSFAVGNRLFQVV